MGLTETLNGLNATSASNGIDVHMMLPTEYGAVAILSASGYGNPKKLRDEANAQKRTTTGNSTGVYFTGDRWEVTASGTNGKYENFDSKLKGTITQFIGGSSWHGATTTDIVLKNVGQAYFGYSVKAPATGCKIRVAAGGSGIFGAAYLGWWRWGTHADFFGESEDPAWDRFDHRPSPSRGCVA